jgi:hypothetical protein
VETGADPDYDERLDDHGRGGALQEKDRLARKAREMTEKTEITEQTEICRIDPAPFRLFRLFRLFRNLSSPLPIQRSGSMEKLK